MTYNGSASGTDGDYKLGPVQTWMFETLVTIKEFTMSKKGRTVTFTSNIEVTAPEPTTQTDLNASINLPSALQPTGTTTILTLPTYSSYFVILAVNDTAIAIKGYCQISQNEPLTLPCNGKTCTSKEQ